jgi:hypothetical protein
MTDYSELATAMRRHPAVRPLTQREEERFQYDMQNTSPYKDWRQEFVDTYGEQPDLSTGGDYDTRTAWRHGVVPMRYAPDNNTYHWPANQEAAPWAKPVPLKAENHPTAWMQTFMDQHRVDPMTLSPWERFQRMYAEPGIAPGGMMERYGAPLPEAIDTRPAMRQPPFTNTRNISEYQGEPWANTGWGVFGLRND